MSNKLMGRATIRIDGQTFKAEKGATLDIGGVKRSTKNATSGVAGFSEEIVQSKLEFPFFLPAGVSVAQIRTWDNVVVSFEADTGQTWIINGGWATDTPVIEESDGKSKIIIEGPPAEEVI